MQKMQVPDIQGMSCSTPRQVASGTLGKKREFVTFVITTIVLRITLTDASPVTITVLLTDIKQTNNDRQAITEDDTPHSRYRKSSKLFVSLQSSFVAPICDPLT